MKLVDPGVIDPTMFAVGAERTFSASVMSWHLLDRNRDESRSTRKQQRRAALAGAARRCWWIVHH